MHVGGNRELHIVCKYHTHEQHAYSYAHASACQKYPCACASAQLHPCYVCLEVSVKVSLDTISALK